MSRAPLIVTLKLDSATFEYCNSLRQRYFPPKRNLIPAHVTLFHALPGDRQPVIHQTLQTQCASTAPLALSFPTVRFLGRGVAIAIDCPELVALRRQLAQIWHEWLTPQDRQPFRPHVTIQNKVTPEAARQLYAQLGDGWEPLTGAGTGLLLWYYRGGPWDLAGDWDFGG